MFEDRHDAGRRLGAALLSYRASACIVLALPRGGVPVGFEVARTLDVPLDITLVRKIGAPGFPELGIGAVLDGNDPQVVLNDEMLAILQPPASYVATEAKRELAELERRRALYRGDRPAPALEGRTVIVVNDGIATGGTVRAVLRALAQQNPAKLVLAVPVAPRETIAALRSEAGHIVCLAMPEPFIAVGAAYRDFTQVSDADVISLLNQAQAPLLLAGSTANKDHLPPH